MKFLATLVIAVATLFIGTAQESQAQFYRGGSGFSIGFGSGGFGGRSFNSFGRGFSGGGFGGYGGRSIGYSSYRPVYGNSFYGGGRSFGGYGGGRSFYGGGRSYGGGRGCGY